MIFIIQTLIMALGALLFLWGYAVKRNWHVFSWSTWGRSNLERFAYVAFGCLIVSSLKSVDFLGLQAILVAQGFAANLMYDAFLGFIIGGFVVLSSKSHPVTLDGQVIENKSAEYNLTEIKYQLRKADALGWSYEIDVTSPITSNVVWLEEGEKRNDDEFIKFLTTPLDQ